MVNLALLMLSSCKLIEPLVKIRLDKTNAWIPMTQTLLLNATLTPANDEEIINWSSSDTKIAIVKDGIVTPISPGTVIIVASVKSSTASCTIAVTQGSAFRSCLNGSNYYLISMDNFTSSTLINNALVADFRPDNKLKTFNIWDNTYSLLSCNGTNFFGETQNWLNLVVNSNSWSGAKFYCADISLLSKFAPIASNSAGYYLHIGIQSTDSTVYLFGLFDEPGMQFAIGSTAFNNNGTLVPTLSDFPRDGKWHEIEIPLNKLKTEQFQYTNSMGAKNIFWFLSGGVPGTKVNIDAIFIYKKP